MYEAKFLRYFNGIMAYTQEWTNPALHSIFPPLVGKQERSGESTQGPRGD